MTIWFCVKTTDPADEVGNVVCAFNVFEDAHPKGKYSWILEKGVGDEEEYWQIRSKYEDLGELTDVALVYRAGDTVILGEVNDNLVPNFLIPLLKKYRFDNLKWIVSAPKR
ncbi:MAG: hypothetical protein NWF00_00435 [Candidatus Bathyarchaeota archaeon]|nr:hypothetical protein [Candidatus Bathyarchaeota archaeon]